VVKDLVCFSKNKRNKTDGLQPKCKECNKQYYQKNRDRVIKRVNENYYENNSQILKRRAELRKRPEAKRKKAEIDSRYYRENKSAIQVYYKQWSKENRDYLKAYNSWWRHRREAWLQNNGNNTLTKSEIKELFKQYPFCVYCGEDEDLTLDHIVPVSRGGQNCIGNITIACHRCNSSKNDKLLSEWNGRIKT
jgi:5-methylcytosine-specific restriction endonuclease McrA